MNDEGKKYTELKRQRYIIDLQRLLFKAEWRLKMAHKALEELGVENPKKHLDTLLTNDYDELMKGMTEKKERRQYWKDQMVEYAEDVDKQVQELD